MKNLRKADQILATTWSILFLGCFLSAGSLAGEVMYQESSSINQLSNYNSHIIEAQQPILLAQEGGRSRPNGVGGSRPEGVGGSRPDWGG